MNRVNTSLGEQTGGWSNVSILTSDELVESPDVLTNDNTGSIVIESIEDGLDILPVGENIKITEPLQKTQSGFVYNIKGEFEIACQSKTVDTYLNNYLDKKVVLIATKHYGQRKLYGSKKFPLSFSYQSVSGQKYEDGSRVRITVQGKIPQKPVFMGD